MTRSGPGEVTPMTSIEKKPMIRERRSLSEERSIHAGADSGVAKSIASGFSIVETLLILVIFSVAILSAGGMRTRAVMTNAATRRSTHASALAAVQTERLMALPYDAPELQDRNGDGRTGLDTDTLVGADGGDTSHPPYTVLWNVARIPSLFDPTTINFKQVRVLVVWKESGRRRRLPLDSFRAPL